MRVLDRLTAVVVALAFVLVGLGAPTLGETPASGAVVTPERPAPPSGDPRAVVARLAHPGAPPGARTELSGGNCADHRAGVVLTDGPDDLLPAVPVRVGDAPVPVVASTRYRPPAVPLPPRGTLPHPGPAARRLTLPRWLVRGDAGPARALMLAAPPGATAAAGRPSATTAGPAPSSSGGGACLPRAHPRRSAAGREAAAGSASAGIGVPQRPLLS